MAKKNPRGNERKKAPSEFSDLLAEWSETLKLVRVQFRVGTKGTWQDVTEIGVRRRTTVETNRGQRYVFDTTQGDYGTGEFALECWEEGWRHFEEEWSKHDGELREGHVRIVGLDGENDIIFESGGKVINPGPRWTPGSSAHVSITDADDDETLPAMRGLFRDLIRERKEERAFAREMQEVAREVMRINVDQADGYLEQIGNLWELQTNIMEDDRASRPIFNEESGDRIARMFEMLGMGLMLKFGMGGGMGSAGFPNPFASSSSSSPDDDDELCREADELFSAMPDAVWETLRSTNPTAEGDLRSVWNYAKSAEANDGGLAEAVRAVTVTVFPALPALKASGTVPPELWERLGKLLQALGLGVK